MKQIPETDNPLVLRTDFSNQAAWETICATIREPVGDFRACVDFLDDVEYRDITKGQLLGLVLDGAESERFLATAIEPPAVGPEGTCAGGQSSIH